MTIAIATYGRHAGKALFCGAVAAEIIGRGAIGGFAVYSVLDDHGAHRQISGQTGGITALPQVHTHHTARSAALISSGPDRPEPLSQFLAGRRDVGLVTGHRLPNRAGADGQPINRATLELMARGMAPSEALQSQLDSNPELDVGLIAMAPGGPLALGNTARVGRRKDVITASRQDGTQGYALLCNAIYSARDLPLGDVVGNIIWGCLGGADADFFIAHLGQPVAIQPASTDRVELGPDNQVTRIHAAEPNIATQADPVTVIHSGAAVWRDGRRVGHCASDVFAAVKDDFATPLAQGQARFIVERA